MSGLVNSKGSTAGVKLLGEGEITSSIHIEVSRASASAIKAVEDAGGTVTCAHYDRLALRALKPHKFDHVIAARARPPPRLLAVLVRREARASRLALCAAAEPAARARRRGSGHAANAMGGGDAMFVKMAKTASGL